MTDIAVPDGASARRVLGPSARVGVTALLALLAVAGNVANAPLVYGVSIIFGSVAVVLAVRLLGVWPAVFVAVAGGAYTWVLWGHPWAMVIVTAEALVLGWLHRRGWRNLVLADLAYWLVLGMALVLLFYRGVMGMDLTAAVLVAVKQALNGIFNALVGVAILLVLQFAWRGMAVFGTGPVRLVDVLFQALLTTILVAGSVPVIVNSHAQNRQFEAHLQDRLSDLARRLAYRIEALGVNDPLMWQDVMEDEGGSGLLVGVAVLDADGAVRASVGDLRTLTPGDGLLSALEGGMVVWRPAGKMSAMARWAKGRYRLEIPLHVGLPPARLVLESPAEPLVRAVERQTLNVLVFLAVLMLLGVVLARVMSQWLARPLMQLDGASARLTDQIGRGERPALPGSHVLEYHRLAATLQDMSEQLAASFARLQHHQHELECLVQQRTAELNQFKTTLDRTLDSVFIFDAETLRFIYANEGAQRLSGYSHQALLQMHPYDIKPNLDEAGFRALIEPLRTGERQVLIFETTHRDSQGNDLPVEVFLQYVDAVGEAPRFVNIVRDISERKRIDRLKSEFVSTVSHELRTPLTAIAGSLGLARSGALGAVPEPMVELLDVAARNSQRLTLLINDLLDIEKMASGQLQLHMREHALHPIVQQAVDGAASLGLDRRVRLSGPVSQGEPLRVVVDDQRLLQVLSNLLSNAVKFSPEGGAVTVEIARRDGCARITVSDEGPGVPEAFRDRIFGKFAQADASDTRQKGGTGLGLAISKELMERMHGQIGFDSVEGQGARFFVDLPLTERPAHSAVSPRG